MKFFYKFVHFMALGSVLFAACGGADTRMASSSRNREKNPGTNTDDIQTVVDGNNAFALDLYQSLRGEDGNLVLSPFSISLALAMTYAGARGETETQMAQVLHFPNQDQLHPAFNALDLALEDTGINLDKDQEPLQLNIANALWAEQTYTFLPDFLDTLAVNYGAGVHLSDFIGNAETERKAINAWVSEKTKDKINDLLPENTVNSATRLVLVNAIYFKGDWLTPFDADNTTDSTFNLLDGTQIQIPTMGQEMNIPYASGDGFQIVELPYVGDTAAMDIIVPDAGRFEEIESTLSYDELKNIFGKMSQTNLMLRMPKFKVESSFQMAETLKEMGMPAAFDASTADFSGMTGNNDLFIGNVIHKAFAAVDEKGTEAAAATAVIMLERAAVQKTSVIIDRPFIFLIRDLESGQILFMGRVLNPE